MYTDEDLNNAIKAGVFTEASVKEFRVSLASSKQTPSVDEENFRLISGFNDIFVVIACMLLLFSSWWVLRGTNEALGLFIFSMLAWGLAEFFVRIRKMALPAIVLLLSFVGGVFLLCVHVTQGLSEIAYIISAAISVIAAYFHWRRFQVPITVAAGTVAMMGFLVALILNILPGSENWLMVTAFICGVIAFAYAMHWDMSDRDRLTHRSDVAFWLHLVSAPLIVHPVFSTLGILDGNESLGSMVIVVFLYLLMTVVSVVVDRRAFMVSSLIYVLYALSNLLKVYGVVGYSFALTGIVIGSALLLLSAFWQPARKKVLARLPISIQNHVPSING